MKLATKIRRAPLPATMNISADSKEELEETITDHMLEGWREISRTIARDGVFHAKLTR